VIVDTSALLAMLMKEPERDRLSSAIAVAGDRRISSATLLEAGIVVEAKAGESGVAALDELVAEWKLEVVPFTAERAILARQAFRRFGKGRHSARLNFGDCFAYALASSVRNRCLTRAGIFRRRT
jgi:ribonuclease VapC